MSTASASVSLQFYPFNWAVGTTTIIGWFLWINYDLIRSISETASSYFKDVNLKWLHYYKPLCGLKFRLFVCWINIWKEYFKRQICLSFSSSNAVYSSIQTHTLELCRISPNFPLTGEKSLHRKQTRNMCVSKGLPGGAPTFTFTT